MTHHWKHRSLRHWIVKGVLFVVFTIVAVLLFGYATMSLWNTLMPAIFGLKLVSFEQAVGLLLLSWIFFGRFRGFGYGRHHHWKHRMVERWMRMSPEEREKFREQMHGRWGHHHHHGEPPAGGNAG